MSKIQSISHANRILERSVTHIERMSREYDSYLISHGNVGGWEESDFMSAINKNIVELHEALKYIEKEQHG